MSFTFGSHCSIAGGYYKAIEEAHSVGCECVQIFTKKETSLTLRLKRFPHLQKHISTDLQLASC